jgi:exopolyphosphatase / guanosine-5'-triphosphate,3'-diphosphate pyrophosphatase
MNQENENTPVAPDSETPSHIVAVIDIGSNLIRMVIAEVLQNGRLHILEQLQRAVRLGHDTFRRERLTGQTMRAAIAILRDYRRKIDFYQITNIRAVATSAVREASNSDTFLERVAIATGIDVEPIDPAEESRITVSAVCRELDEQIVGLDTNLLIAEVGGGSTLLTVLKNTKIKASQSIPLGSIRLQEALATVNESPEKSADILSLRIRNEVEDLKKTLPLKRVQTFVALGGDARFAARQVGKATSSADLRLVKLAAFNKLVKQCLAHTPEELVSKFGLPFSDAETLNSALLIYQSLLEVIQIRQFFVSHISMRDGLLLDLTYRVTGQEDEILSRGVIDSAFSIAEKYRVNLEHARKIEDLAVALFDELQAEHQLNKRHRLLLRVAAILHEAGDYISSRAHHKHSYYLIINSEIFGLNRDELSKVALVARYHRRAIPKSTHAEYISLDRERRMVINKLAALLRVADALDAAHIQQVETLRFERQEEEFIIYVTGGSDLSLERRSLGQKGDLFEDIFGLKVRLEEDEQATN